MDTIKKAKKHIDRMISYNHSIDDIIGYIKGLSASGLIDTEGFHTLMDYHYTLIKGSELYAPRYYNNPNAIFDEYGNAV